MVTKYELPEQHAPIFDDWFGVIIIFLMLCLYIVYYKAYRHEVQYIEDYAPNHPKWPATTGLALLALINTIVIVCLSVLLIVGYKSDLDEHQTVVEGYRNGNYLIVEGEVESFSPMSQFGHDCESFEVDGVQFSYSSYVKSFAYNQPLVEGGVITGNGQYVRIGYIEFDGVNHIVLIQSE